MCSYINSSKSNWKYQCQNVTIEIKHTVVLFGYLPEINFSVVLPQENEDYKFCSDNSMMLTDLNVSMSSLKN